MVISNFNQIMMGQKDFYIGKFRLPLEQDQRLLYIKSIHRVQQSLRRRKWPQLPVHLYDLHVPHNQSFN